jgi:hypothetical protein
MQEPEESNKSSETQAPTTQETTARTADDLGQSQVQERFDKETAQGFRGVEVDPTPNENYSVQGVIAGKPTPETDADAAHAARQVTGGHVTAVEQNAKEKQ